MSKVDREYSTNLKDLIMRYALSTRRPSSQTTTKTYTHLDHRPKSREPDWSQSTWQANESVFEDTFAEILLTRQSQPWGGSDVSV
jgi:hypothetical protein